MTASADIVIGVVRFRPLVVLFHVLENREEGGRSKGGHGQVCHAEGRRRRKMDLWRRSLTVPVKKRHQSRRN